MLCCSGEHYRAIMALLFLFLLKYICCGYTLEVPHRGTSNEYPQRMFTWMIKKNVHLNTCFIWSSGIFAPYHGGKCAVLDL